MRAMWCCDISRLPLDARVCSGLSWRVWISCVFAGRCRCCLHMSFCLRQEQRPRDGDSQFTRVKLRTTHILLQLSVFIYFLVMKLHESGSYTTFPTPRKRRGKNIGMQNGCVVPPTVDEGMPFEEHNLFDLARQELNRWCTVLKMM